MSRRTVVLDAREYEFATDDEPPRSQRWWGLIRAQVLDEITGRAPASRIRLASGTATVTPRLADDGTAGLLGIPRHVFPAAAPGFRVEVTVDTPGYVTRHISATLPTQVRTLTAPANADDSILRLNNIANLSEGITLLIGVVGVNFEMADIIALGPGASEVTVRQALKVAHAIGEPVVLVIPDNFAPMDVGPWDLRSEPVIIHGRVMESDGSGSIPVNNSTLKIVNIWRKVPPASALVPPETSVLLSVHPPLYRDRAVPGTTLRQRNLLLVGANSKRLLESSDAGSVKVRISDRVGLAIGDIVAIGVEDTAVTEYVELQAVVGGGTPDQPAVIETKLPLRYQHRESIRVEKTNPQPLGPVNQFDQVGLQGDACVFADGVNGIAGGNQIEIDDGAVPGYHTANVFDVHSDAAGFYSFPPLHRIGQLRVRAEFGAKSQELIFQPDYTVRENRLDFFVK